MTINNRVDRALVALVIFFAIIFFFAFVGNSVKKQSDSISQPEPYNHEALHKIISETLIKNVDPLKIKEYLRAFTKEPHPAGLKLTTKCSLVKYNVLLSYPNYSKPNQVSIVNGEGKTIFQSTGLSPVVFPDEQGAPGAGIQWLAYSANESVEGDLVYCHYGRPIDFQRLNEMGVSVKGKIAIMRYHSDFRAIPKSVLWMVRRQSMCTLLLFGCRQMGSESTLMTMDGDLLTPLYPSKADLYGARTIKEAKKTGMLPDIPVLPLSYSDAYQLLSRLEIKEIRNLIGYIYGAKEPDEYVMWLGHYPNNEGDWLEACRSLVFCAWDAEEYGLIGSTEFLEEFANIINDRTIVYLNVDLISDNSTLNADTIPSMIKLWWIQLKKFLTQ
uniref:Peptidase M28 domain-containing protein n=1 Tax=Ditylenchus dipsaci TaxID=166011 RepID=A0A915DXZ4_9BILA